MMMMMRAATTTTAASSLVSLVSVTMSLSLLVLLLIAHQGCNGSVDAFSTNQVRYSSSSPLQSNTNNRNSMALFSSTGPSPPSTNPPPPGGGAASIPASAAPGSTSADGVSGGDDDEELELIPGRKPSQDWELDCYSRPVVAAGGKKLWEVLLTDATGSFRYRKALPSNQVNSKELRKTVEALIEDPRIETKPSTIRFFRGAMFNSKYPPLCRHRKILNQCLFGFPGTSSSSQLLTPLLCSILFCPVLLSFDYYCHRRHFSTRYSDQYCIIGSRRCGSAIKMYICDSAMVGRTSP